MDYIEVEEAVTLPGLRLVLTAGVPNVWGEAAKGIFHVKQIRYTPVRQIGGAANEALLEWTHQTSAPVAVYENERPRARWDEILFLAERLQPQPRLIPDDPRERALMFGFAHEICGEQGIGWTSRLLNSALGRDRSPGAMGWKYGFTDSVPAEQAKNRLAEIFAMLADQLHRQRAADSQYFIGEELTALDVYWAAFSNMAQPLPPKHSPMPKWLRSAMEERAQPVDPILIEHRDHIYSTYLPLPQDF